MRVNVQTRRSHSVHGAYKEDIVGVAKRLRTTGEFQNIFDEATWSSLLSTSNRYVAVTTSNRCIGVESSKHLA